MPFHDVDLLKSAKRTALWGNGIFAQKSIEYLSRVTEVACIVDSNRNLHGQTVCTRGGDIPIISQDSLPNYDVQSAVIVPYGAERFALRHILQEKGLARRSIFFANELIPMLAWELDRKIVLPALGLFVGTPCTLRCHDCIAGVPYFKHNRGYFKSAEELHDDLAQSFSRLDYVNLITLATGEVFLHPEFDCLLDEIYRWRRHFHQVSFAVNGTVLPKERVLRKMSEYGTGLYISDYSAYTNKAKVNELIAICRKYDGIRCTVFSHLQGAVNQGETMWSDIGDMSVRHNRSDGRSTESIFLSCANRSAQSVHRGKLYGCGVALWREVGGLYQCAEHDYCSLSEDKETILKFYLGLTEQGYYDVCTYCDGVGPEVNPKSIPAGIQIGKDLRRGWKQDNEL